MGESDKQVFRVLGRGVRKLPCPLPEDDLIERAHQIGELDAKMEVLEEKVQGHKDQIKGLNTQIETYATEIREHARAVRSGCVERPVDIRTEISPGLQTTQVIREDTGEVIEERPSTPDERQGRLFNEQIAAQVDAALKGGKPDVGDDLDLSPLTPEEQEKREAEAREYLKGRKKRQVDEE